MFKECPHPDEKQRLQLSRELGLAPRQIKFWFQNRRTQIKVGSVLDQSAFVFFCLFQSTVSPSFIHSFALGSGCRSNTKEPITVFFVARTIRSDART